MFVKLHNVEAPKNKRQQTKSLVRHRKHCDKSNSFSKFLSKLDDVNLFMSLTFEFIFSFKSSQSFQEYFSKIHCKLHYKQNINQHEMQGDQSVISVNKKIENDFIWSFSLFLFDLNLKKENFKEKIFSAISV